MKYRLARFVLGLGLLGASAPIAQALQVYTEGSSHIRVTYSGGNLVPQWFLESSAVVDSLPIGSPQFVNPANLIAFVGMPWVPRDGDPAYAFIGVAPGWPIYEIPIVMTPGRPFIAIGADDLVGGDWSNLAVSLISVAGPAGSFFSAYNPTPPVAPEFATSDGIDALDTISLVAGGHAHHQFAFTEVGVYYVTLEFSGLHAVDGLKSAQGTFIFGADAIPEPAGATTLLALLSTGLALFRRRGH